MDSNNSTNLRNSSCNSSEAAMAASSSAVVSLQESSLELTHDSSTKLDVAFLYKGTETPYGCGHTIPWKASALIDLHRCPVCMEPVGMICDGLMAPPRHFSSDAIIEKDDDDNDDDDKISRTVRFKFGKQIYQLSTSIKPELSETRRQQQQQQQQSTMWRYWSWLASFIVERKSFTTTNQCTTTTALVQDRITQALNLANLKVLHKGKVLYPPPGDVSHSDGSEPTMQEVSISQAILKISDENWNSSKTNNKKKVPLVVMGTLKERQLKGPSKVDTNGHVDNSSSSLLNRLQRSVWFPISIFQWSLKLSWLLVKSFISPFLPSYMIGGERNDGDGSANDISGQMRPHQD